MIYILIWSLWLAISSLLITNSFFHITNYRNVICLMFEFNLCVCILDWNYQLFSFESIKVLNWQWRRGWRAQEGGMLILLFDCWLNINFKNYQKKILYKQIEIFKQTGIYWVHLVFYAHVLNYRAMGNDISGALFSSTKITFKNRF